MYLNSATLLSIKLLKYLSNKMFPLWQAAEPSGPGFCHVRIFTYLSVAKRKQAKIVTRRSRGTNKIRKTHTFWRNFFNHGEIFSIMEKFDSMLSPVIDSTLGQRCSSIIGYQFSEIVRSLMSVYFCGGSCVEDVTSQLMRHLSYHPTLRTCSSDTILRAIRN